MVGVAAAMRNAMLPAFCALFLAKDCKTQSM
uniref:Uncharacterized protein n=1 Tax=Rhizophora mucronata TaxID=61149 RepID=A0A2P2P8S6_RHIMU